MKTATELARKIADQELEACCEWVGQFNYDDYSYGDRLRAARRRPTPPSLKEQALEAMSRFDGEMWCEEMEADLAIIRTAIESLPS